MADRRSMLKAFLLAPFAFLFPKKTVWGKSDLQLQYEKGWGKLTEQQASTYRAGYRFNDE